MVPAGVMDKLVTVSSADLLDWSLMNEQRGQVLAGDSLMCSLMRADDTAWLSPSLRKSHDNGVSVTSFDPVTPT